MVVDGVKLLPFTIDDVTRGVLERLVDNVEGNGAGYNVSVTTTVEVPLVTVLVATVE